MRFINKLAKDFVSSAVRQVGRDGGKIISNQIYKGKHGTPVYNSLSYKGFNALDSGIEGGMNEIDMSIQPRIKSGGLWVVIRGILIQIIPFGSIAVLVKGITLMKTTSTNIYEIAPNRIADKRYKEGYRIDGYNIIKTSKHRLLQANERKDIRSRGISYLLSIVLFFAIAYLIFISSPNP